MNCFFRTPIAPSRISTAKTNTLGEVSPKAKLIKYLNEIKKQADSETNPHTDKLDKWIEKNSIIEVIPSKLDDRLLRRSPAEAQSNDQSFDEQFMRSFDYSADGGSNCNKSNQDATDRSSVHDQLFKINKQLTKTNGILSSRYRLKIFLVYLHSKFKLNFLFKIKARKEQVI